MNYKVKVPSKRFNLKDTAMLGREKMHFLVFHTNVSKLLLANGGSDFRQMYDVKIKSLIVAFPARLHSSNSISKLLRYLEFSIQKYLGIRVFR